MGDTLNELFADTNYDINRLVERRLTLGEGRKDAATNEFGPDKESGYILRGIAARLELMKPLCKADEGCGVVYLGEFANVVNKIRGKPKQNYERNIADFGIIIDDWRIFFAFYESTRWTAATPSQIDVASTPGGGGTRRKSKGKGKYRKSKKCNKKSKGKRGKSKRHPKSRVTRRVRK